MLRFVGRTGRKPVPVESLDDGMIEAAARAVEDAGALPIKKLCNVPLSHRAQLMLFEALERRGFERTPRLVRIPLGDQLATLVTRERRVDLKGLKKRLLGCSSDAEAKRAAVELCLQKRALWVVTETSEGVAAPDSPTLTREELDALSNAVARLGKLAKRLKPAKGQPPRTVERSLVADVLRPLSRDAVQLASSDAVVTVLAELRGARESTFVPDLVRRLAARVPLAQVREALVLAARAGRVELRPESGIGLLSPDDRDLCPLARDGTPLSYVRLTD